MSRLSPEDIAYQKAHADDDQRPGQITACAFGIAIAISAVIARIIAKRRSPFKFGWDDYTIVVALIAQLMYAALTIMKIDLGGGLHMIFVRDPKLYMQAYIGTVICYSLSVMFTKISLLLFYNRIFPIIKWLRIVSYIVAAVVVVYSIAVILVVGLQCIPLSSVWTGKPGRCFDSSGPFSALAVVNVVTDFAILSLPIKPVLDRRMSRKRKIQVLSVFLVGGIVCVFGLARTVAIFKRNIHDLSYDPALPGIWSFIEMSVGIAAACMPLLGKLFRKSHHSDQPSGSGSGSFSSLPFARWVHNYNRNSGSVSRDTGSERAGTQLTEVMASHTRVWSGSEREYWAAQPLAYGPDLKMAGKEDESRVGTDVADDHPLSGISVRKDVHQSVAVI